MPKKKWNNQSTLETKLSQFFKIKNKKRLMK